MKYIQQAIDRLNEKGVSEEKELSLIERILVTEKDPNLACILALDLILVGIDTVSIFSKLFFHFFFQKLYEKKHKGCT